MNRLQHVKQKALLPMLRKTHFMFLERHQKASGAKEVREYIFLGAKI
jgi:hypothetical protein